MKSIRLSLHLDSTITMRAFLTPTFLTVLIVGRAGALVTFQTLQVAHPSLFPKLYYRNRNIEDERYATNNRAKYVRRGTATPPTPLRDAEHRHVLGNTLQEAVSWCLPDFKLPDFRLSLRLHENGINYAMMKSMAISQGTILSLTTALSLVITTCMGGTFLDSLDWIVDPAAGRDALVATLPGQLLLGVVSAIPMIFLSQMVDQASSVRDASRAHFATTNMVLKLFGRRRQDKGDDTSETTSTMEVILFSFVLAAMTSLAEETIFRGYIPAAIVGVTHSMVMAWLAQAIIFGVSHIHPQAQEGENQTVASIQTVNALMGYGLAYAVTGTGSLIPCIIGHTLYDMHVLVSSWRRVNEQMDWTEDRIQQKFTDEDVSSLRALKEWAGPSLTFETLSTCRRFFYAFDEDHKHALSLSNVQRAMCYAFMSDEQQPSTSQVKDEFSSMLSQRQDSALPEFEDRIDLAEFLKILFSLRASLHRVDA